MRSSLFLSAALLAAAPAAAATGDAAAGLAALKQYNLIVIENLTASHDVEGRTLVGGNLSGQAATFGQGSAAGGQSAMPSTGPTLIVGGNNTLTNANINNGKNGALGSVTTGASMWIGGNNTGNANLNGNGAHDLIVGGNLGGNHNANRGDTVRVGGNVSGHLNINGGTVQLGGTAGGANFNSGSYTKNLGSAFQQSLAAQVTETTNQVVADVLALSAKLASLTVVNASTITTNANTLTLNAIDGGNGFALFNLDAATFAGLTKLDFAFGDDAMPVIINVTGASALTFGLAPTGGNTADRNQQVIWNFVDATSLDVTRLFHGSIIAPNATLYNHTPIEGSVVARNFVQGGEVHLGTYAGDGSFLIAPPPPEPQLPAVPEPASWAMMLGGFAVAAVMLRRKPSLQFA